MTDTDDGRPYEVAAVETGYEVRSEGGRIVMACRDEASASHYATMLSDAYSAGFRQGYQKGVAER